MAKVTKQEKQIIAQGGSLEEMKSKLEQQKPFSPAVPTIPLL